MFLVCLLVVLRALVFVCFHCLWDLVGMVVWLLRYCVFRFLFECGFVCLCGLLVSVGGCC